MNIFVSESSVFHAVLFVVVIDSHMTVYSVESQFQISISNFIIKFDFDFDFDFDVFFAFLLFLSFFLVFFWLWDLGFEILITDQNIRHAEISQAKPSQAKPIR